MLFSFSIWSKKSQCLNKKEWKDELEMYITGIVQNHRHKMLATGAIPDHFHILVGYNVNQLLPDLIEEIKTSSNALIKGKKLSKFKFEWQKGCGAFTHSHYEMDQVAKYILSQEEHNKKRPFKEEYFEMLDQNNVQFKKEHLFEFFEDIHAWD